MRQTTLGGVVESAITRDTGTHVNDIAITFTYRFGFNLNERWYWPFKWERYRLEDFFVRPPTVVERQLIHHLANTGALQIVDVGAGSGRIEKYARDQGIRITGIELDGLSAKLAQSIHQVNVESADIADHHGTYDAVLFLGGGFPVRPLGGLESLLRFIDVLLETLKPDGHLAFTVAQYNFPGNLAQDNPPPCLFGEYMYSSPSCYTESVLYGYPRTEVLSDFLTDRGLSLTFESNESLFPDDPRDRLIGQIWKRTST